MHHDAHGLPITVASAKAATAWDRVVMAYVGYRANAAQLLAEVLEEDPNFGLAHCLQGYFMMLGFNVGLLGRASAAAAEARKHTRFATGREQAHVAALEAWQAGHMDRAVAIWDDILRAHPRDLLAFRLAHFVNFWMGRPDAMLASVREVAPHWGEDLPGYGAWLACRCFALEECGHFLEAEGSGRAAIARDPGDLWATHAVAHTLEMQGRRAEGIDWLEGLRQHWDAANNLRHHVYWHAAMFHLEHGDTARVLALYDAEFRNLASPLTTAQPDLYIDVQNAISMLFRLERQGVDVGDRWTELADKAEARIGDCLNAFTLPHWAMALAATGREAAASRMLEAMRGYAAGSGIIAEQVRLYALPVSEAALAHRRGQHAEAVRLMRPALGGMYRLGGSHAQQDVLEQLYLDAAVKAGDATEVRRLLERVSGRHPVPVHRRIGYAEAARSYAFG